MLNKILLAVLAFFSVLIAVEIGVYFYTKEFRSPAGKTQPQTSSANSQLTQTESAVNEELIDSLKKLSPYTLASSTLHNEYQGKVTEISFEKGRFKVNDTLVKKTKGDYFVNGYYEYEVSLTIKQDQEDDGLSFFWNKDTLSKMTVFEKGVSGNEPLDIKDIKIGDDLTIREVMDLKNKECYGYQCLQEYTILKNN